MTLRLHKNYGGILQNYALVKVLQSLGHEVNTINIFWDIRLKGFKRLKKIIGRTIKKYILLRKNTKIFREEAILLSDKKTTVNTSAFKFSHNNLTTKVYVEPNANYKELENVYDAFVVGSDQVWRPRYTKGLYKYFLDFVTNPNIKKLSYAASFGCDENEYSDVQSKKCGDLIAKFDGVSVREESAIDLIKTIHKWNVEPIQHIDPTMLLDKSEYLNLISSKSKSNKVFIYVLDKSEDKQFAISAVSKVLQKDSFTLLPEGLKNDDETIIPPIEHWLESIAHSDFVITDSFHGAVFSIIFNTPFLVYGNSNRGKARFASLLRTFELEDRYIENSNEVTIDLLNKQIDWNRVNHIIQEERKKSFNYLQNILK